MRATLMRVAITRRYQKPVGNVGHRLSQCRGMLYATHTSGRLVQSAVAMKYVMTGMILSASQLLVPYQ